MKTKAKKKTKVKTRFSPVAEKEEDRTVIGSLTLTIKVRGKLNRVAKKCNVSNSLVADRAIRDIPDKVLIKLVNEFKNAMKAKRTA